MPENVDIAIIRACFPHERWQERAAKTLGVSTRLVRYIAQGERRLTLQQQRRLWEWLERAPADVEARYSRVRARELAEIERAGRLLREIEGRVNPRKRLLKAKRAGRPLKARASRFVPDFEYLRPGEEPS